MRSLIASYGFDAVGLILAIIGTYYSIRYVQRRRINYTSTTIPVIVKSTASVPGLELRFTGYGESLDSVSVTLITLWNGGSTTIRKKDVLAKDNLRVQILGDAKILSAEIVRASDPKNGAEVTRSADRKSATLKFDHFAPRQGLTLQIVHTATDELCLNVLGSIADTPIRRRDSASTQGLSLVAVIGAIQVAMAPVYGLFANEATGGRNFGDFFDPPFMTSQATAVVAAMVGMGVTVPLGLWLHRQLSRPPRGLRVPPT